MAVTRDIVMDSNLSLIRLLQLVSPSLPTGSFSYSQGLEWAIEAGWVQDASSLADWLQALMRQSLSSVDLPLLRLMYQACNQGDLEQLGRLCDQLMACRESDELQQEERNRGRAMAALLASLGLLPASPWQSVIERSQLAGFSLAALSWDISPEQAANGYLWAWLENQVLTGIKTIPLGQTQGQQLLLELAEAIPQAVSFGLHLDTADIGASSSGLALASCYHETQYTRIYRS